VQPDETFSRTLTGEEARLLERAHEAARRDAMRRQPVIGRPS